MIGGWQELPFDEVIEDVSGGNIKTPQGEYLAHGQFAVVDQGKALVAGYVDDKSRLCHAASPVIVFGDHTRCFKYVDFPFCMGADGVKVLRPKIESDAKYLYHYFNQLPIPNNGYDRHYKYLKRNTVTVPPVAEQRRIAEVLDRADALRAKRRAALAQLDSLTQSIFLDMFGDPATNTKQWPSVSLVTLCASADDIKCGPFGTQLAKQEYRESGFPLWGIKNVNASFEIPTREFLEQQTAERLKQYLILPGDIVMTRKGTIGNCAVYPSGFPPGIMHSDLLRLRLDVSNYDPSFVAHQLQHSRSVEHQLALISGGAVMPGINVTKLKSLLVIAPPPELQQTFARRIAAIEKLKNTHRAALTELDALFASLQHRAFRGEL